jgi:hypothetical protein
MYPRYPCDPWFSLLLFSVYSCPFVVSGWIRLTTNSHQWTQIGRDGKAEQTTTDSMDDTDVLSHDVTLLHR